MNVIDWIVLCFIIGWFVAVILFIRKKKKDGGCIGCGGCNGKNCSSCDKKNIS